MAITDAQSVKNTESAREKGYDAGKKVSGIASMAAPHVHEESCFTGSYKTWWHRAEGALSGYASFLV